MAERLSRKDFLRGVATGATWWLLDKVSQHPIAQNVLKLAKKEAIEGGKEILAQTKEILSEIRQSSEAVPFDLEPLPLLEPLPFLEPILNLGPVNEGEILSIVANNVPEHSAIIEGDLPSYFSDGVRYWWNTGQISKWAKDWSLNPLAVASLMQIESAGNQYAVSSAGALGLFQPMPDKFAKLPKGYNRFDPDTNAKVGLDYFSQGLTIAQKNPNYSQLGALIQAAVGYNGGHGLIGKPYSSLPLETKLFAHVFAALMTGNEQIINWYRERAVDSIVSADASLLNPQSQEKIPEKSRVFDKEKKEFLPSVGRVYQEGKISLRQTMGTQAGKLNPWNVHGNKDYLGVPSWFGQDYVTSSPNKTVIAPIEGVTEVGWDPKAGYFVSIRGSGSYQGLFFRLIHLRKEDRFVGLVKKGQKIGFQDPQEHIHVIVLWGDGTFSAQNKDVPYSLLLGPNNQPDGLYKVPNSVELFSPEPERFTWFEVR